jgi:hypothetical protein
LTLPPVAEDGDAPKRDFAFTLRSFFVVIAGTCLGSYNVRQPLSAAGDAAAAAGKNRENTT